MRIKELRTLLKAYAGQPGNLPKASVLSEILKYAEQGGSRFLEPEGQANPAISVDINTPDEEPSCIKEFKPKFELPPVYVGPSSKSASFCMPAALVSETAPTEQKLPEIDGESALDVIIRQVDVLEKSKEEEEVERRIQERQQLYTGGSDMELTFLGTASCTPGLTRGVSCVAMRYNTDIMLFDCGEGTQVQMMRASIKVSRIRRIFVTHLHGDHAFGLAGVLCLMGQAQQNQKEASGGNYEEPEEAVEIYGPEGIRDMVRAVIQLSYSHVVPPHRIHELKNLTSMSGRAGLLGKVVHTSPSTRFNELQGTDFYPDSSGQYTLLSDTDFTVTAAPMMHTIPCVGFVVTEKDKPGSLRVDRLSECVARNRVELQKKYASKRSNYQAVYNDLKKLKPDEIFTFPDGTEVVGRDVCDPPLRGRKVVYMGDTCNGDKLAPLAENADVLIHEATNAFFPGFTRFNTYKELEWNTKKNGHSTPEMAGRFAHKIGAKKMFLSHFSARYLGDLTPSSVHTMLKIEKMAENEYMHGLLGSKGRCVYGVTNSTTTTASNTNTPGTADGSGDTLSPIPIIAAYDFMKCGVYRGPREGRNSSTSASASDSATTSADGVSDSGRVVNNVDV